MIKASVQTVLKTGLTLFKRSRQTETLLKIQNDLKLEAGAATSFLMNFLAANGAYQAIRRSSVVCQQRRTKLKNVFVSSHETAALSRAIQTAF